MFNPHHRFFFCSTIQSINTIYSIYNSFSEIYFFRSAPFIRRVDIVNEGVPMRYVQYEAREVVFAYDNKRYNTTLSTEYSTVWVWHTYACNTTLQQLTIFISNHNYSMIYNLQVTGIYRFLTISCTRHVHSWSVFFEKFWLFGKRKYCYKICQYRVGSYV